MLKVNHLYRTIVQKAISTEVLKDVNFQIDKGEFVAVMGPSGAARPHCSTVYRVSSPMTAVRYFSMIPTFQRFLKNRSLL